MAKTHSQHAFCKETLATIVFVGIDLAKNVFALHGVDDAGRAQLLPHAVRRDQVVETATMLPPCTIGMEAWSGAHRSARQFMAIGQTVGLMATTWIASRHASARRPRPRSG